MTADYIFIEHLDYFINKLIHIILYYKDRYLYTYEFQCFLSNHPETNRFVLLLS